MARYSIEDMLRDDISLPEKLTMIEKNKNHLSTEQISYAIALAIGFHAGVARATNNHGN